MAQDSFGRRKTDSEFVVHVSEEIGRLKEGYAYASTAFQTVLTKINELDAKIDKVRDALYGNGPEHIGIFERIRSLTYKVGLILFVLGTAGGFLGRYLEKVLIK